MLQTYLSFLQEKTEKNFFDYSQMAKDMWRDKVHDAKKEFKVFFNTENDVRVYETKIKSPLFNFKLDCPIEGVFVYNFNLTLFY